MLPLRFLYHYIQHNNKRSILLVCFFTTFYVAHFCAYPLYRAKFQELDFSNSFFYNYNYSTSKAKLKGSFCEILAKFLRSFHPSPTFITSNILSSALSLYTCNCFIDLCISKLSKYAFSTQFHFDFFIQYFLITNSSSSDS